MRKKVPFLIGAGLLLAAMTYIGSRAAHQEAPLDICDTSDTQLTFEKKAFTQEDLNSNFESYAQDGSRVSAPDTLADKQAEGTNVVGVVLDNESEAPVAGAEVSVNGTAAVTTDSDGRFQIENVADGKYTWGVSAEAYQPAEYKSYGIDRSQGVHIFTFYIDKNRSLVKDRSEMSQGTQSVPPEIDSKTTEQSASVSSKTPASAAHSADIYHHAAEAIALEKAV